MCFLLMCLCVYVFMCFVFCVYVFCVLMLELTCDVQFLCTLLSNLARVIEYLFALVRTSYFYIRSIHSINYSGVTTFDRTT